MVDCTSPSTWGGRGGKEVQHLRGSKPESLRAWAGPSCLGHCACVLLPLTRHQGVTPSPQSTQTRGPAGAARTACCAPGHHGLHPPHLCVWQLPAGARVGRLAAGRALGGRPPRRAWLPPSHEPRCPPPADQASWGHQVLCQLRVRACWAPCCATPPIRRAIGAVHPTACAPAPPQAAGAAVGVVQPVPLLLRAALQDRLAGHLLQVQPLRRELPILAAARETRAPAPQAGGPGWLLNCSALS